MRQNEIEYMSILKAVGIILIVIGHSGSPLHDFVYLFHLALFVFVSGYFYKDTYSSNLPMLVRKRITSLYFPFIKYQLLFLAFHNVLMRAQILSDKAGYLNQTYHYYTGKEFVINFFKILSFLATEGLAGSLWFIPFLFYTTIIFGMISYILYKTGKSNTEYLRFIIILLLFAAGYILQLLNVSSPRGIFNSFVVVLIFYFGYMYSRFEQLVSFKFVYVFAGLIVLLQSSVYGTIHIGSNIVNPPFFILNTLLGIYVSIYISKKILGVEWLKSLMKYIGNNTWLIMAFHELSFKPVNYIQIQVYDYPSYMLGKRPVIDGSGLWWVFYAFCGVFIPVVFKYCIELIFTRLSELGKRIFNPADNRILNQNKGEHT
ncbi:MAG: acyltransferase family protein [Candidatus Latescibacterota bacterium]